MVGKSFDVVSSGAWLEIDLLRQRRERYGTERPPVIPVRTLLLRGALFGSVLPLILLLSCIWLWSNEGRLRQRAEGLQPLADEHDRLEVEIKAERQVLAGAVQTNRAVARAMVNVRSSSALLAELRRLIPQTSTLDQVRVIGNELKLDGNVLMPDGLRTINALMLSLSQSRLLDEDGVTLQQVRVQPAASAEFADQGRLSYSLSARFASDAPQAIRSQLAALGASGLEKRLLRLEQEEDLIE